MNQKIDELAERAKLYAREQMSHNIEPGLFSASVFQEKFAELIIEECRSIVLELYHKTPFELCGPLITADGDIVKHFYGVEE